MQSYATPHSYFSRFPSDLSAMTIDCSSQETRSQDTKSFAGVSEGQRSEVSRSAAAYGHNEFLLVFDSGSGSNKIAYFLIDVSGKRKKLIPKQNTMTMNKVKDITDYGVVVMDNYLYLCGGKHVLGAVLRYCHRFNPDNNQWRPLASMNVARARHTATALDGYIYVCGGELRNGRFTDSVERFDPMTDSWTELRPMFSPRADHAAVAAQSKLFVSGGIGNRSGANINFWEYDPKTDFWTQARGKSMMPRPKERHSMVHHRNKIYCIGGVTINRHCEDTDDQTILSYDCSKYNVGPKLEGVWDRSHPDLERSRCSAGAIVLGHYIYLIGGQSASSEKREPVIEYYNINRSKWQSEFRLAGDGHCSVRCCVVRVPTANKQFSTLGLTMTKPWIMW